MKRFMKVLSCLALAAVILLTAAAPAFAAESSMTYLGRTKGFRFQPGSTYTDSDMFESFKGVMPGDTRKEIITIANEATDCDYIKLYMRAQVHDEKDNPLSPGVAETGETVATMTEFLAQLSMKVYNGTQLIYSASPDELGGLAKNVLLGTFRKEESARLTVELEVPLTLDNRFANRTGEVDWVFTAEAYDDPTPPNPNYTYLTVKKIWEDGSSKNRPDSVTVNLLRNNKFHEKVVLNAANQWTYTWSRLDTDYDWSVEEAKVPAGYEVSYKTVGNITFITNSNGEEPDPGKPEDLTVIKKWEGDSKNLKKRPDSIKVTLYDGDTAIESVWLSENNNWRHTWYDLDGSGNWSVVEAHIPNGYTPTYSEKNGVVTITNTAILIQTGQLNWPIFLLGGLGIGLILFGLLLMRKQRKDNYA